MERQLLILPARMLELAPIYSIEGRADAGGKGTEDVQVMRRTQRDQASRRLRRKHTHFVSSVLSPAAAVNVITKYIPAASQTCDISTIEAQNTSETVSYKRDYIFNVHQIYKLRVYMQYFIN